MEWGLNPESVQAAATTVGLVFIVLGGAVALNGLRTDRKTRSSQILLTVLRELNELFIPGDVYDRLVKEANSEKGLDPGRTLTEDHIVLNRVVKAYNAIGQLVGGGMVDSKVIVRQVRPAVLQRHEHLAPLIDPLLRENDPLRLLLEECRNYATSSGLWPRPASS